MCHVFRARREDLGMDCALKVLRDPVRRDERVRDLFLTEADLSLLLRHPNLIRCYDAGELNGRAYIVMELLDGGTLGDLVESLKQDDAALPDDLAVFVVAEMLAGLHALHEAAGESGRKLGIVHRDVTTHNVFLGSDGRVILGDYGVAQVQAHGSDLEPGVPGKLAYLSPESLAGDSVDRRADIYSAGVILYELLVGRRPYDEEQESATMEKIMEGKLQRPRRIRPDLPHLLESLTLRALARKPKDRYPTAASFREELKPQYDPLLANPRLVGGLVRSLRVEEGESSD